ncbi:MAG: triphosphoribosyl-dephospho-CoA synthase [bacterium]
MKRGNKARLSAKEVAQLAQIACLLEVTAEKPGNVTRWKDASDMGYLDFLLSAVAIAPAIESARNKAVGEVILKAIRDTHRFTSFNTNLGIVLLFAPIAKAYFSGSNLRDSLHEVLSSLTVGDAQKTYEAIRIANPGGMGKIEKYDISQIEVDINLKKAMELAQDRDLIAKEYVTDFEITFTLGVPELMKNWRKLGSLLDSIVQTFLVILSQNWDSKISRTHGKKVAEEVTSRANEILEAGGIYTPLGRDLLTQFDLFLRENKLNPGTTADLVTASLFVAFLEEGLEEFFKEH